MTEERKKIRCLIALTDTQKDSMDLFARNISRKRAACHLFDRITASTVMRCLIDIFMERWGEVDMKDIANEKELLKRIGDIYSDTTS